MCMIYGRIMASETVCAVLFSTALGCDPLFVVYSPISAVWDSYSCFWCFYQLEGLCLNDNMHVRPHSSFPMTLISSHICLKKLDNYMRYVEERC